MFILDRIDRELLHSLERLELKFGLSSEFFDKIPVRLILCGKQIQLNGRQYQSITTVKLRVD